MDIAFNDADFEINMINAISYGYIYHSDTDFKIGLWYLTNWLYYWCSYNNIFPQVYQLHKHWTLWIPLASTKEVNPRLAKHPLVFNGRLANCGLTSLVKEATDCYRFPMDIDIFPWFHNTCSPYAVSSSDRRLRNIDMVQQ